MYLRTANGVVEVRTRPLPPEDRERIVSKAVEVARAPHMASTVAPADRSRVEELVKAIGNAASIPSSALRTGPNRGINAAALAQRAAQALQPSSSITPSDIEAALRANGMDMVAPFSPGTPLQPYYGYGRRPRDYDYQIARNTTTQTRPDRIPFDTLLQLWQSYDVAQSCTRYSINDLRSMRVRFTAMEGHRDNPVKEIAEAKRLLRRPNGRQFLSDWIAENQRNLWIYDSAPIFRYREGGKLKKLINVSAKTIAPMLDYYGDLPEAPAPAFQQFIEGVPWDWLTLDDLIYEPFWPETDSPYGTPPLETVLINANCYSSDTEVLTRSGWKLFADVDVNADSFATRNPVSGELEWQWATKHHQAAGDGIMFHAKSKNMDLLVTGGHRLLVERVPKGCPAVKHGDMWLVHAEDLYRYQQSTPSGGRAVFTPATSVWNAPDLEWFSLPYSDCDTVRFLPATLRAARAGRSLNSLVGTDGVVSRPTLAAAEKGLLVRRSSAVAICELYKLPLLSIIEAPRFFSGGMPGDDYAAFMGMWLSEGSVRREGSNIYIAQEPKSKGFVEFREALRRILGVEPTHDGRGFTFGHTALADYLRQFGKADEKFVPQAVLDMSRRQLEIFWHFYVLGDGHYHPAGHVSVTTVSRRMADGLQEVIQKLGMSAAIRKASTPISETHHQRWILNTRAKQRYSVKLEKVSYDGDVFCVSVPNKTLYVRRNGVPAWCANTDIRLQNYFLDFFTKGQVPEAFAFAPEGMTDPDALAELQEDYNNWTYGDQSERWGLRWLPSGTKIQAYKPDKFDPDLAEYVMRRTISAFGLTPQNLGILADVNRASGETQNDQQFRVSTLPIVGYYEDLLDSIIQDDWGLPVQIRFDTGREKEDRLNEAKAWYVAWQMGAVSSDEYRDKVLGMPIDLENPNPRTIDSQRLGPVPLSYAQEISGPVDPLTFSPSQKPVYREYLVPGSTAPDPLEAANGQDEGAQAQAGPPKGDLPKAPAPNGAQPQDASKEAMPGDPQPDSVAGPSSPSEAVESEPDAYGGWAVPGGSTAQGTGVLTPEERGDLTKWRANARKAVARGKQPRPFTDSAISGHVYGRVWANLESAANRAEVDAAFAKALGPSAAGVVVQASDTGRVLMVQRTPDKHDPSEAYARWEWPGGKLEPGESPFAGGLREWSEETGAELPDGWAHAGNWTSPDGAYTGFVVTVPHEADLELDPQAGEVANAKWWDKADLDDPKIRDKVTDTLDRVTPILKAWSEQGRDHQGKWRHADFLEWQKFHRHTDTIVDHYAPQVKAAMAQVLSPETLRLAISEAYGTHGDLEKAASWRDLLRLAQRGLQALRSAIARIYGEGYMQGSHEAAQAADGAMPPWTVTVPIPADYWETWTPGVGEQAATQAQGGLAALLRDEGIWIKEMTDTQVDRIGEAIAAGIAKGFPVMEVTAQVDAIVNDAERAYLIAETEYCRAMGLAAMETYRLNNVPELKWLHEPGACSRCLANAVVSPQPTSNPQWPFGGIPVHPHERCAVAPFYGSRKVRP